MKILIPSLILLYFFCPTVAQENKGKELELQLQSAKDTARVLVLDNLCVHYSYKDPEKALEYGLLGLQEAEALNYIKGLAYLNNDLGVVYGIQNNYSKALSHFLESFKFKEKAGDRKGMASSLNNIALIYKQENDYEQALKFLHDAYNIKKDISPLEKASGLNALAITYTENKQYERAENLFLKMLFTAENEDLPERKAEAMKNLAWHFFKKNEPDESLVWYNKALEFEHNRKNLEGVAGVLMNMSRIFLNNGEFERTLESLQKAEEIFIRAGNKHRLVSTYTALTSACFDKKVFHRAIAYAKEGLQWSQQANIKTKTRDFFLYLHKSYDSLNNKNEALAYFKKHSAVKDSLLDEKKIEELASMRSRFSLDMLEKELALKNKDVSLANAELKKQKITTYFTLTCLVLILVASFFFIRKQQVKIKLNVTTKKLQTRELENLRLKKDHLQNELDLKKKRLTTYALSIAQKNGLMKEIKADVGAICEKITSNGVSKELQKLKNKLNYSINVDNDWDQFKLYFEQVHQGFFPALKINYPQLTNNELRLCALVRLNMSIKEMANLLGISPQSVKMARHRLRKKLDMCPDDDFNDFFMRMGQRETHFEEVSAA